MLFVDVFEITKIACLKIVLNVVSNALTFTGSKHSKYPEIDFLLGRCVDRNKESIPLSKTAQPKAPAFSMSVSGSAVSPR